MKDFEVFTVEAVVDARSVASLTFVITLLASFGFFVCPLIVPTLVLALLTFSVFCALRADALVESIACAFGTTWVTLTTNRFAR